MLNPSTINPLTLPSLPLTNRRQLPNCPAIYFVMESDRVLYIGRAANLMQRWTSHHRTAQLESFSGVKIAWIECSDSGLLTDIESALIEYFDPLLNNSPHTWQPLPDGVRRVKSRLAILMAERDPRMSQRELAEKSGVSAMAINRLYNNDFKRVDTETLEKLCAYFECDLSELLVLKEELSPNKTGTKAIASSQSAKTSDNAEINTNQLRTRSILQVGEHIEIFAMSDQLLEDNQDSEAA